MTQSPTIAQGDLSDPQVIALLERHMRGMYETSPPENVFALDLSGLQTPDISFWTVHIDNELAGCGALKQLSDTHGEIKSMRTHDQYLRRGVGGAMLTHIIKTARARGLTRLSLETGSHPAFDASIRLYTKAGFAEGSKYAAYPDSDFSRFFHLDLA